MKTLKSIYFATAVALCAAPVITGCDDDETYDFPGTDKALVYDFGSNASYDLLVSPILVSSSVDFNKKAQVNRPVSSPAKVTYGVDNSLVAEYNDANSTEYLAVPEGILLIENPTLTIPAGANESEDAFNLKLDETKLTDLDPDATYLVPVKMLACEGCDMSVSANKPSYLILNISTDVIVRSTDVSNAGVECTDFTGWSASCSLPDYDMSVILDGDAKTSVQINEEQAFDVTIDMGKERRFQALRGKISENYWGDYWYDNGSFPQGTKISISTNGTDWLELGTNPNGSSWSAAEYIVFAGPVTARYIKLGIPVVSSYYGDSAEFYCGYFSIYEK